MLGDEARGVLVFDGELRVVGADATVAALLGVEADALVGSALADWFPDVELVPGGATTQRVRTADGRTISVRVEVSVFAAGTAVRGAVLVHRVSDASGLEPSSRFLAQLIANLPGMVYRCESDEAFTMRFVSEGSEALLGYAPDELVGNRVVSFAACIHPEDLPRVRQTVDAAMSDDLGEFALEYRVVTRLGQHKWVWERGAVVDDAGGVPRLEGFVTDLTSVREAERERAELRQRLAESQRFESLGNLAAGIAHDFNNGLSVVSGVADELAAGELSPRQAKLVTELRESVLFARDLAEQMLTLGRASGQTTARVVRVDVAALLERIEALLVRLGGACRVSVESAPGAYVNVAIGEIEQVLANLVINARDATPAGGTIRISATADEENGHVLLIVADTGSGIGADDVSRIFDPYFTTKPSGTGLGLATVRRIVEQRGGSVELTTGSGGTTFFVRLPAQPAPSVKPTTPATLVPPLGAERVLVVDDDELVRRSVVRLLGRHGYELVDAAGVADALAVLERDGTVQAVVSDLHLEDGEGSQIAEWLERHRPTVPILIVTGSRDVELSAASADVLHKPFEPGELVRRVRTMLDELAGN